MNETNQTDRFAPLFAELDRRLAGESPVRLAIEGGRRERQNDARQNSHRTVRLHRVSYGRLFSPL